MAFLLGAGALHPPPPPGLCLRRGGGVGGVPPLWEE